MSHQKRSLDGKKNTPVATAVLVVTGLVVVAVSIETQIQNRIS